jgi:sortase A
MPMLMIALILTMTGLTPTMAADYNFEGVDAGTFGKPSSVEPAIVIGGSDDESSNINRSKDSSVIPPPFISPDANVPGTGELLTPYISGVTLTHGADFGNPMVVNNGNGSGTAYYPASSLEIGAPSALDISYSSNETYASSSNKFTLPDGLYYDDESIGTLKIPELDLSVKVYEEESLENMRRGIGHFKSTSCWEGNVGFAAHNRGNSEYFGEIHTLDIGDRIIYSTKLGTRTYEVFSVSKVNENDVSSLQRATENIVTLITCVNDVPELRWCVQAREAR